LKDDLIADFEYLEKHFEGRIAKRIIHSKLIFWFLPIIAAFMIVSPLPDEVGLLLLASIKLKYHRFFLLSFPLLFDKLYSTFLDQPYQKHTSHCPKV